MSDELIIREGCTSGHYIVDIETGFGTMKSEGAICEEFLRFMRDFKEREVVKDDERIHLNSPKEGEVIFIDYLSLISNNPLSKGTLDTVVKVGQSIREILDKFKPEIKW